MTAPAPAARGLAARLRSWWVPLAYPEKTAVILAIVAAHCVFFVALRLPLLFDAAGYFDGGREIAARGLFTRIELSHWRTYGYPLLLSFLTRFADWLGAQPRLVIFEFQLAAYLAAVVLFRRALCFAGVSQRVVRAFHYALCLNPCVLILVAHVLTESTMMTLALLVMACLVTIAAAGSVVPWYTAMVAAGSLMAGAMVMVRPTAAFILPLWFGGVAASAGLRRPLVPERFPKLAYTLALAALCCGIPWIPQLTNNAVLFARLTPLTSYPMGALQQKGGIEWMKYGSAYIPGKDTRIVYENPFAKGTVIDAQAPWKWYLAHPAAGAATAALHVFNLLDQDLPMPYNTALRPVYYPWFGLANHAVVGLALAGALISYRLRRKLGPPTWRVLAFALVFIASYLAVHAFFSVEARYGACPLLLIYPFAVLCCHYLRAEVSGRKRLALLLAVACYVACAAALTGWVRDHSPQIRGENTLAALLRSRSA